MRRLMFVALIWFAWARIVGGSPDAFEHAAVIHKEDSYEFRDLQTFAIAFGPRGGRVTVIADTDTPLARWLAAHDQARILMRLALAPEPERLSR